MRYLLTVTSSDRQNLNETHRSFALTYNRLNPAQTVHLFLARVTDLEASFLDA